MRLLLLLLLLALVAAAGAATPTPAAKPPAAAAAPPPPPDVMAAMSKGGCKAFADLIAASPEASSTYKSAAEGGVTVFCPSDDAVRAFMPRYKNLTADGKASLLLFHAVPVHYSLSSLKSNNGPMNTLATDGAAMNYNFTLQNQGDVVTIKTAASAGSPARVKATVLDKDPVAIYAIDSVVEPVELFKPVPAPAPAPAPVAAADAPKASKAAHRPAPTVADAPGPSASDHAPPEDRKKEAKKSAAAAGAPCVRWLVAVVAAASTLLLA
ncbi:hypothetical protein QOZ80_6BG0491920 [Eleusine coracana subsp. coracana]|nr:hypothetical protein QOZ80_6BG0491920 [Eleusine coracana subsp. coracana]